MNPLPAIVTIVLGGAALEERAIVGVLVVTVKMACAVSPAPPPPLAVTIYTPGEEPAATVNEAVSEPPTNDEQAKLEMSPGGEDTTVTVPQVSAIANPLPVTVTGVATEPELGVRVSTICGPVTVNEAVAESPPLPV